MIISGSTILGMTQVLMMITDVLETCMGMSLIDAASTASTRHTVFTALRAITADEAASAHGHNR